MPIVKVAENESRALASGGVILRYAPKA